MPRLLQAELTVLPIRPRVFVGADPGVSGGIAVLTDGSVECWKMPESGHDLWQIVRHLTGAVACVELVTGWTGGYNREGGEEQARQTNPGAHMFRLGESYGRVQMALTAAGIRYDLVTPRTWQQSVGMPKRPAGMDGAKWKRELKARAAVLFPDMKVTLNTCDALLLALHCRMTHER